MECIIQFHVSANNQFTVYHHTQSGISQHEIPGHFRQLLHGTPIRGSGFLHVQLHPCLFPDQFNHAVLHVFHDKLEISLQTEPFITVPDGRRIPRVRQTVYRTVRVERQHQPLREIKIVRIIPHLRLEITRHFHPVFLLEPEQESKTAITPFLGIINKLPPVGSPPQGCFTFRPKSLYPLARQLGKHVLIIVRTSCRQQHTGNHT